VPFENDGQTLDGDYNSWQEGKLNGGSPGAPSYAIVTSRSHHPGGVNSAMMDGSVRFVTDDVTVDLWRAMATRNGGEVISE
jgi:prepilin-type processing-associated H-X9-DG protein